MSDEAWRTTVHARIAESGGSPDTWLRMALTFMDYATNCRKRATALRHQGDRQGAAQYLRLSGGWRHEAYLCLVMGREAARQECARVSPVKK